MKILDCTKFADDGAMYEVSKHGPDKFVCYVLEQAV